ncbi:sensor histidine kinase [Nonomuraea sp. 3N208]|uniref:sensor histidine kinase n=1 Tax=Nonomuraea sp. 3N208 TaxID=3457421 RepID=UPI003FCE5C5A
MSGLRPIPRTTRGRLLAGIIVLVTVGLVGSDLATYALLHSSFTVRAERRLTGMSERIDEVLARGYGVRAIEEAVLVLGRDRVKAALVDGAGRVFTAHSTEDPARDALIRALRAPAVARLGRDPGRSERLEVAGDPYRIVYHALDVEPGASAPLAGVIVAVSLRDDEDTLHQVAVTEAIVTSVALLALIGLAFGVLRVGLRPLKNMAAAAAAIAGGDRARHIPVSHPHTEAGRLAVALNQAFDRQRRAEERLRRFVADVSHELRTPLSTIGGWADLYFQGGLPDPEATTTAMSRIADQAAGMRRLVEDLLLLARLDQQRPLETAPVDLQALVSEIVSDARVIAPDRTITLTATSRAIEVHAGEVRGERLLLGDPPAWDEMRPATVTGDAERLRRLLRNLLGNALQHTPPGTPVHVSVNGSPSRVRLAVADEGPGIPADKRAHLFERFYQGDPVRRHGSGLGLAIARAIAEAHGGTIELRTSPHGSGSEFSVTLPAACPAAP